MLACRWLYLPVRYSVTLRKYAHLLSINPSLLSTDVLRALAASGHQLVGLGIEPLSEPIPKGVTYVRYGLNRGTAADVHPGLLKLRLKLSAQKFVHMLLRNYASKDLFLT